MMQNDPLINLYRITVDNKMGYINAQGKVMIKPAFDMAGDFRNGLARVFERGREFIPGTGSIANKFKYINCWGEVCFEFYLNHHTTIHGTGLITEGLFWMKRDEFYGYYNTKGEEIIPFIYTGAKDFSEGLAAVKLNGKWGYIDKTGNTIIPFVYDAGMKFSEGLAAVKQNEKVFFINTSHEIVIQSSQFVSATFFAEGLARVAVNAEVGLQKLPDTYTALYDPLSVGDDKRKDNIRYGFINKTGAFVIPPNLVDADWQFREGLVFSSLDGKHYGYSNTNGETVLPFLYQKAFEFSEGIAAVCKKEKEITYITPLGEELFTVPYEENFEKEKPARFENGLVSYKNTYLNKKGETIWPKPRKKAGFTAFTFKSGGQDLQLAADTPQSFADLLWQIHLDEEHVTYVSLQERDSIYQAVLVPWSMDWFGHIIEEVLENSQAKQLVPMPFLLEDAQVLKRCIKKINQSGGDKKFLLGMSHNEDDPYFMLLSVKAYSNLESK